MRRSSAVGLAWHVVVVVFLFAVMFAVRWDSAARRPDLPLFPRAVLSTGAGSYFAWMMSGTASDEWLYFAESQYVLRGTIDRQFNDYKISSMDGVGLAPSDGRFLRLPYRDMSFEYPPLAVPFIVWPGIFASTVYVYRLLYSLTAALFFLGAAWVSAKIYDDLPGTPSSTDRKGAFLTVSLAFAVCFGPLLVSRLDVFAVFFVILSFRAAQKESPAWAGVGLALAVATKLYPVVFLPFFLVYFFRSSSWKRAFRFLLGFAGALALIYAPILAIAPQGYLQSLRYHSRRGVEIESLWASWAQVRHVFGFPAEGYTQFGSANVAWAGEEWVKRFWIAFALPALAVVGFPFFARMMRREPGAAHGESDLYLLMKSCLGAVLVLMLTSKVLSPQYILWIYPLCLWVGLRKKSVLILGLAVALLTQWLYPYRFEDLTAFGTISVLGLATRNLLLAALFVFEIDLSGSRR